MNRQILIVPNKYKLEFEDIIIYSKKVTADMTGMHKNKNNHRVEIEKINNIINSVIGIGEIKDINELDLKENCKEWISNIFNNYPDVDERDVKELLNDFTSAMNTRMRSEEKYVLCLITNNGILLCHSIYGEETMTPDFNIIDRMLDKDNVIRYVYFNKLGNEGLKVNYMESNSSIFFSTWLGLNEKETFAYLGGKNKICCEIDDISLSIDVNDDDFENKILNNKNISIKDGVINFSNPIYSLPIKLVRVGKKPYKEYYDFLNQFMITRHNLKSYTEKYIQLKNSIDYFNGVLLEYKTDIQNIYLKQNIFNKRYPNIDVIFCDNFIKIDNSYLSYLKSKILNEEKLLITHVGDSFSPNPIQIGSLEIYNDLNTKLSSDIIKYYADQSLKDYVNNLFKYIILKIISLENNTSRICYFLNLLADYIISNSAICKSYINSEDNIIEYKNTDWILGKQNELIKKISKDITSKLLDNNIKVYFIGMDEKTKTISTISKQKFPDDRLNYFKNELSKLNKCNIEFFDIPLKYNEIILILVAKK